MLTPSVWNTAAQHSLSPVVSSRHSWPVNSTAHPISREWHRSGPWFRWDDPGTTRLLPDIWCRLVGEELFEFVAKSAGAHPDGSSGGHASPGPTASMHCMLVPSCKWPLAWPLGILRVRAPFGSSIDFDHMLSCLNGTTAGWLSVRFRDIGAQPITRVDKAVHKYKL